MLKETLPCTSVHAPFAGVVDDPYSDRIRCDHPEVREAGALARRLESLALARGRGRVVALVPEALRPEMEAQDYTVEAVMPGFYQGHGGCAVMGRYLDPERGHLANPREVGRVHQLLEEAPAPRERARLKTRRAAPEDAQAIAGLLGETFSQYPTPSHEPAYVAGQIEGGTPFRLFEEGGELLACASADLVPEARTAELTDCATVPQARGRGLMQSLLLDLMGDLRQAGYPTAFTLARARIPGINLAFQRLGFALRGCMPQSCRIGEGLEDMHVWSRALGAQEVARG